MKRFTIAVASVFSCLTLALGGCAGTGAKKEETAVAPPVQVEEVITPVVEVTAGSLNIRETPSTSGSVVGTLKSGDRARAPQPESGGWTYVETDSGTSGYVASQYVRAVEMAAAAPTPQAPPAAEAAPEPAAAPVAKEKGKVAANPPPAGSSLARITPGMTEGQVVEILGDPTSQQNYVSGNAFNPFYYGANTSRLDYRYKGIGIVVFNRSRYSGGTKVASVSWDPNEDGYP